LTHLPSSLLWAWRHGAGGRLCPLQQIRRRSWRRPITPCRRTRRVGLPHRREPILGDSIVAAAAGPVRIAWPAPGHRRHATFISTYRPIMVSWTRMNFLPTDIQRPLRKSWEVIHDFLEFPIRFDFDGLIQNDPIIGHAHVPSYG
jgi:hypothetical protein